MPTVFRGEPEGMLGVNRPPTRTPQTTQPVVASQPNRLLDDTSRFTTSNYAPSEDEVYSGIGIKELEAARLSGNPFTVNNAGLQESINQGKANLDESSGVLFGVGEDVSGYDKKYVGGDIADRNQFSAQGQLTNAGEELTDSALNQVGLQRNYAQDKYKGYTYNNETGQYDYYDNTPSKLEQAAPALIKAGVMMTATAGFGSALGGSAMLSGMSTATSSAIGNAVAAGAMSAAQGGDLKDVVKNAALGGLGGYVKGAREAAEAAQAAAGVIGATAEAADTARALQSSLEVATKVQDVVKLGQAVASKDILGVIKNGLSVAGMESLEQTATSKILALDPDNEFLSNNAKELATATLQVTDKLIKGESIGDAVRSGVMAYIQDGGGIRDLLPESGDFKDSEILKTIADTASEINRDYIKPVIEGINNVADETVRALPTTKEDWQNAEQFVKTEVLDPAGEFTQKEIIDPVKEPASDANSFVQREVIDPVQETASELNEEYVRPLADSAGEIVDDVVDTVKDYGDEFGDLANKLISGMLGGLGSGGSRGGSQVAGKSSTSLKLNQFQEPKLVRGFDLDTPFINPLLRG